MTVDVAELTDLELTRLCAEAMGLTVICAPTQVNYRKFSAGEIESYDRYAPLHDDAQAMALVKKFLIGTQYMGNGRWAAWLSGPTEDAKEPQSQHAQSADLNRAIVECCARTQAARIG